MSGNSFGALLKAVSFGESHGRSMGVVLEGVPAGLNFDEDLLRLKLECRRPGSQAWVSSRNEPDDFEILSGLFEGKTLGTPLAICVHNKDIRSEDYKKMLSRQGHADQVWKDKYVHVSPSGGGRSSGRETVSRVIVGSVAQMILRELSERTQVLSCITKLGQFSAPFQSAEQIDMLTGFSDKTLSSKIQKELLELKEKGNSVGAQVEVYIFNPPKNLGRPVFDKIKARFAAAFMSVGAVCSVSLGESEKALMQLGSEFHNDSLSYGGSLGGITTGETLVFKSIIKPSSSLGSVAKLGRHDPCIALRALPVLEAMSFWILADELLMTRCDNM